MKQPNNQTIKRQNNLIKNFLFFFVISFLFTQTSLAQLEYWLEFNEGYDIGSITQTTRANQTIEIDIVNNNLENFMNNQLVYKIKKAFPTTSNSRLQRTYIITLNPLNGTLAAFLNRPEIANFAVVENIQALAANETFSIELPNDYEDVLTGGRNTALDLIKAPLAWKYSTGQNVLIGISDSKYDENHPDLQGQIIDNIQIGNSNISHGTGVAGMMVANSNNDEGIVGLSHDSQLIAISTNAGAAQLIQGLQEAVETPNVRVVNCSWVLCSPSSVDMLETVLEIANTNGVLVVAAAGNGAGSNNCNGANGYGYPAAFDEVIGVTAVGQRFSINEFHDLTDQNGDVFWERSWKDCFNGRPDSGQGERNHNDKINVSAPGHLNVGITDNYAVFPDGVRFNSSTSGAAPFVTGLAALLFSANPELTPGQVKNIIESTTDDIYHIPFNEPYIGKLGTGRINAYRATLTAHCTTNPGGGLDLAMQNSLDDDFTEPDITTSSPWFSKDIWVRKQDDGMLIQDHENPEYHSTNPNYVYVRVTNDSCETSDGTDDLELYWAKASTSLSWPGNWDGSFFLEEPLSGDSILMGAPVDTLDIPSLEPGESTIITFPWLPPNPEDYALINDQPWHFCLLARINSSNDPMTVEEDSHITSNVLNNNNLSWKNLTVVDYDPNNLLPSDTGGVVRVSNPNGSAGTFDLILKKESNENGKSIYDEAEVSITMDDVIFEAWNSNGKKSSNLNNSKLPNKKIVSSDNAIIEDISLEGNTHGTVYISFNFLTDQLTNKKKYVYHLIQKDAVTDEVIGGETFEIRKKGLHQFQAQVIGPATAIKNVPVSLSATLINEDALYNWYDSQGNLIHQGENFNIVPIKTETYKLEVIATKDGFKDYDQVSVSVPPHEILSVSPNPSSSNITVDYFIQGAATSYLTIVNTNNASTQNYVLDLSQDSITIDITSYLNGYYEVALITDNEVQDSETILKN